MKNNLILGAIAGDVIGSAYEFNPMKKLNFELFIDRAGHRNSSSFTDDTVMTVAVADWLSNGGSLAKKMQNYGRLYPDAGYGGNFFRWIYAREPKAYNSFGNGSAMRVSPVGWAFNTLEETLDAAKESAEVSHNHPEGIKGAQAIASSVFMARKGKSKDEIKEYVMHAFDYDLNRTCNHIREDYSFDVSCQGSTPESIICFLESNDYESAVRLAVSLGGDADTMGAMAGGIAEAFYGDISNDIRKNVVKRLPEEFVEIMESFTEKVVSKD